MDAMRVSAEFYLEKWTFTVKGPSFMGSRNLVLFEKWTFTVKSPSFMGAGRGARGALAPSLFCWKSGLLL
jgi:hypothetical protein